MTMDIRIVLPILAVAWGIQGLLAMRQMQAYRRRLSNLMKVPSAAFIGIGVVGASFLPGVMIVLVTDADGRVLRAERMTGISVVARLHDFPGLIGADARSLASLEGSERYRGRLRKALKRAAQQVLDRMASQAAQLATSESDGSVDSQTRQEGGTNARLDSQAVVQ
jgi:DNA-binding transcriptional regulator of glucitol operon